MILLRATILAVAVLLATTACDGGPDADAGSERAPAEVPAMRAEPPADAATAEAVFLDPNVADRDALLALPGMDADAADALIAGRPYESMLQVDAVLAAHLDEAVREALYAELWHPLDLNTATAEEIELIPGVGERMRHEFEEYRPYRGMAEFRREIGKYVDEEELDRLERYVTIR